MSAIDYYSLDDILVTQERVPCTFNLTVPKLGLLFYSFLSRSCISENRVRFTRSIKNHFTFVKNREINDICYLYLNFA